MGLGRALFHVQMATKQAHGPINLATQIEAVFSHVLLAENHRFSYFAGTRLRVREKLKNYYSIMTYGLKDATQHNNSKTFVAFKITKNHNYAQPCYISSWAKTTPKAVLHVKLQQLAANCFLIHHTINEPWPCFPSSNGNQTSSWAYKLGHTNLSRFRQCTSRPNSLISYFPGTRLRV